jgi:hypothetical protein
MITSLHFTPDGVSGRSQAVTMNIALLTEGDDKLKSVGHAFLHEGVLFC